MLTLITALAAGAAAQTAQPASLAPPANPHAQHMAMDPAKMDHSKMDHKAMGKDGGCCCKPGADGKMGCMSDKKAGAASAHEGHSGH